MGPAKSVCTDSRGALALPSGFLFLLLVNIPLVQIYFDLWYSYPLQLWVTLAHHQYSSVPESHAMFSHNKL